MESIDFGFTSGSSPRPGPTTPDSELAFPELLDFDINDDAFAFDPYDLDTFCFPAWDNASSHGLSNGGTDLASADEGINQPFELGLLVGSSSPIDTFNVGSNRRWPPDDICGWHETSVSCQPENEQGFLAVKDEDSLLNTPQSIEEASTTAQKAQQARQIAALPTPREDFSPPPSVRRRSKEKKHACPNTDCNRLFRYPKDVQRHHECVHENKRPLQCPHETCKYHWRGFKRGDALKRHMRVHNGAKKQSK